MPAPAPPPVAVEGVHKRFEIPREQVNTLKERALHPFRRGATDTLHALRGVSFAVAPGEFFGIVGRNGSGKSTLLKCLAGIYGVDSGAIYVNGRMSTFIELGVGFNPDLPARDNAMLNATMLGLSPREARRRFDSVIDFAELREFIDLKIKNYSSGMLVRLAFSVMIHVDAEILLIDEVLAVGDAAFQQKCFDEFERIHASGATVLFVTHDMDAVRRFCDRALLLEHGRPVMLGDPERVGERYLDLNFSMQAREAERIAAEAEESGGEAEESGGEAEQSGGGGVEGEDGWTSGAPAWGGNGHGERAVALSAPLATPGTEQVALAEAPAPEARSAAPEARGASPEASAPEAHSASPEASAATPAAPPRAEQLGRRIKGPSALGSDPRRLLHLTWALAKTEFKLKFFGSVLGYLWQLMRPLLLFGVIYVVISASKLADGSQPFYPASLLLGIVLFTFFSESSGGAVSSLVDRENLVRKIEFPRLAVPLSIVVTALLNLSLNLLPVLIFLLAAGSAPHWSWLALPLVLAALACLSAGLGMILSVGFVRYRDVRPIWEVVLQMTFYASGIFIALAGLKAVDVLGVRVDLGRVLLANPFAALLQEARHVFISPSYPSAASAIGGDALLLIPIGITVAVIVGGFLIFDRRAPSVAEQL